MNRLFLIIIAVFAAGIFSYANEKQVVAESADVSFAKVFNTSADNTQPQTDQQSKPKKEKYVMKDPAQMIKLGKTLTFIGIGGYVAGSLFAGAGLTMLYFGLRADGVFNNITDSELNSKSYWIRTFFNPDNPNVSWLSGLAIGFIVGGAALSAMAILLIPGIIMWAIGAGARDKGEESSAPAALNKFKPMLGSDGIGLSISL
jgi:hypothetical protein